MVVKKHIKDKSITIRVEGKYLRSWKKQAGSESLAKWITQRLNGTCPNCTTSWYLPPKELR